MQSSECQQLGSSVLLRFEYYFLQAVKLILSTPPPTAAHLLQSLYPVAETASLQVHLNLIETTIFYKPALYLSLKWFYYTLP